MKTKNLLLLPALIAVLNLKPAGRLAAQTFTTLHSFTPLAVQYGGPNSDGAGPYAGLITNSSGSILYGTARVGGSSGHGTVFAVNNDGTGFTTLHSFTAAPDPYYTNSDGALPQAGLILSGNTLYGTASGGGGSGKGTVFKVNIDGTGFTNLHSFTGGSDGAYPYARLILSGDTLYGTAESGGSAGHGTVFALNSNGTGFTNLHSFTALSVPDTGTNNDGAGPYAGLILSGSTLYGTANEGGSSGHGTVFALKSDGTGFTNLHSFAGYPSDGARPRGLCLSGNTLYGTASGGGSAGRGTVFAIKTDGTGFRNLHIFAASPPYPILTNSDGVSPLGGLIVSGNTLYGTAQQGGSSGWGTAFAVNTDGTGFTNLHSFTAISNPGTGYGNNSDGALPQAGLILSGNTLYGTAWTGGSSANGTVFSLSFRPQLTITPSGPYVILSWPTNVAGFDYTGYTLQSAHAITGSFADIPASTTPYTIPIASAQQFFRLSQKSKESTE